MHIEYLLCPHLVGQFLPVGQMLISQQDFILNAPRAVWRYRYQLEAVGLYIIAEEVGPDGFDRRFKVHEDSWVFTY